MAGSGRIDLRGQSAQVKELLNAAARTTAFASGTILNRGGRQLIVQLETTAIGTASLTLSISEVHVATGTKTLLLASAAITTNVLTRLRVSPFLAADIANAVELEIVPAAFSVDVAVGNANPASYRLSYQLCP